MAILTVFRSRLVAGIEELYDTLAEETSALARQTPGFVEEKTFTAADSERVTIVLFANRQSHEVWRDHPRHREIQIIGRTQLYAEYHVYTAEVDYSQSFVVDALS